MGKDVFEDSKKFKLDLTFIIFKNYFMRLILITFYLMFLTFNVNAENIYHCTDDGVVGFQPTKNYKSINFNPTRFTVKINLKEKKIISKKLNFTGEKFMDKYEPCVSSPGEKQLYCLNTIGSTFTLNRKTLKFHRSYIFNSDNPTDTIFIAHGSCETF